MQIKKIKFRWKQFVLLAVSCGLLAGCASNPREKTEFYEKIHIENRPVVQPVRAMSSFSDSLGCMDHMLRGTGKGTTLITSKNIPDASGKVFVATKEMIITALSQMSRTSNSFRYVDYEIDAIKQDTVQTLTALSLNSGQMKLQRPTLYISGAISYLDMNVMVNRMGAGIAGPNIDIGISKDTNGTAFGLEMHLGEFATRTLFPGVDSANDMVVANMGGGVDAGGRIKKTGVQFNFGSEVSQGVGPAVRTLVDIGMIELIGKWARIPYWQCLALDQAHPEYQRQLRDWWEEMSGEERLRLFQNGLRNLGYFNGAIDGRPSAGLRAALLNFQADQKVVPSGNINFDSYEILVKDYVQFDGSGHFIRIGWTPQDRETNAATNVATSAATTSGKKMPMALVPVVESSANVEMATEKNSVSKQENILKTVPPKTKSSFNNLPAQAIALEVTLNNQDGQYNVGEPLVLTISTDVQAYLYCYYQDASGVVAQVYPNQLQRAQPIQGNYYLQIPDLSNPKSFTIDLVQPGSEALICAATRQDLTRNFPEELKSRPLTPLAGTASIFDIKRRFEQVSANAFSYKMLRWVVKRN